jgi:hypothetical protein
MMGGHFCYVTTAGFSYSAVSIYDSAKIVRYPSAYGIVCQMIDYIVIDDFW